MLFEKNVEKPRGVKCERRLVWFSIVNPSGPEPFPDPMDLIACKIFSNRKCLIKTLVSKVSNLSRSRIENWSELLKLKLDYRFI